MKEGTIITFIYSDMNGRKMADAMVMDTVLSIGIGKLTGHTEYLILVKEDQRIMLIAPGQVYKIIKTDLIPSLK